jgi:serine/threonine-protein kinase|tara:strand:+ start:40153 stop:42447 length:2295 start_codon:yes stop_codon:yes gene_type:complete
MDRPFPAYQGDEPYIFVSYAHEDSEVVFPEIQWLKEQGFNIWYDEGINPGSEWRRELAESIEQSSLFLYFVSPTSASSEHCEREVNYAIDQKKPLLVAHLEETTLPSGLGMSLSSIQAIMRYQLADLDYRIKLLNAASDHIRRGIGAASSATVIAGTSHKLTVGLCLAALLLGAGTMGLVTWNPRTTDEVSPRQLVRFPIVRPAGVAEVRPLLQPIALSNDGSLVVFSGQVSDGFQLFSRKLDELNALPIRGTEVHAPGVFGPGNLALAPGGDWVAFIDSNGTRIRKVRLSGGQPVTICEIESGYFQGMTWGPTGTIVFTNSEYRGLMRVPENGGNPEPLTHEDVEKNERHIHPHFLPEGGDLVFTSRTGSGPIDAVEHVVSLAMDDGEQRLLIEGSSPQVALSGHLLFFREGVVWAAPFDLDRLEVVGDAVPIVEGVRSPNRAHYSVSASGSMVYISGSGSVRELSLVWVDRDGSEEDLGLDPKIYRHPRLSPDGKKIAVVISDENTGDDIWIYSIARGALTPLTFDEASSMAPLWSPDSQQIVFASNRSGQYNVYRRAADGTGTAEPLTESDALTVPRSWSADGQWLQLTQCGGSFDCDLALLSLHDEPSVEPLLTAEFSEGSGALSPDGRWIAYHSNESGDYQIYVRPFPDVENGRWQVSIDGGLQPVWAPDGQELFFWSLLNTTMAVVPVEGGAQFIPGTPRTLFSLAGAIYDNGQNYSLGPDGQRFLIVKQTARDAEVEQQIIYVHNWYQELTRLAPVE